MKSEQGYIMVAVWQAGSSTEAAQRFCSHTLSSVWGMFTNDVTSLVSPGILLWIVTGIVLYKEAVNDNLLQKCLVTSFVNVPSGWGVSFWVPLHLPSPCSSMGIIWSADNYFSFIEVKTMIIMSYKMNDWLSHFCLIQKTTLQTAC